MEQYNAYEEQLIKLIENKKEYDAIVFLESYKNNIDILHIEDEKMNSSIPFICLDNECWMLLDKIIELTNDFNYHRPKDKKTLLAELTDAHQWWLVKAVLEKESNLDLTKKTINQKDNNSHNFIFDLINCEEEQLAILALKSGYKQYFNISAEKFINNPHVCPPLYDEHTDENEINDLIKHLNKKLNLNKTIRNTTCLEIYAAKHNMFNFISLVNLKSENNNKTGFINYITDKIQSLKDNKNNKPKY